MYSDACLSSCIHHEHHQYFMSMIQTLSQQLQAVLYTANYIAAVVVVDRVVVLKQYVMKTVVWSSVLKLEVPSTQFMMLF